MRTKTGRDVNIVDLTEETYVVPAGEEHLYHVLQEVRRFDQNTGKRQSIPAIQKYGQKTFANVYDHLLHQGFTVKILHDPKKYNEALAVAAAEKQAEQAEQARKAAAAQKEAEREAMKAEILNELRQEAQTSTEQTNAAKTKK